MATIQLSRQSNKKKTSSTNRNQSHKLHELAQNLEFVVKRITGSAAWQHDLKNHANAIVCQIPRADLKADMQTKLLAVGEPQGSTFQPSQLDANQAFE
ncbi:hypothetical protein VP01_1971g2 [Puccinia sorghi]|uniref:Uncharacterized protein n=1 Tax=Puccinia sorghi TaxID=27349 RepID=A0A0L6VBR2_9BASI|nr:hypothetical protein VP01_1971g2 [Puccinia sorghi]